MTQGRRWLPIATLLLLVALASPARGQEPIVQGPTPQEIARFHEESSGISEHSTRRAGIEVNRRHAPFDLTWGLR